MVSNSSDITASVNSSNDIGSTQEYLVSIYVSKMNLSVGSMCINHVIYQMRQLFWNWPNSTYSTRYLCWIIMAFSNFHHAETPDQQDCMVAMAVQHHQTGQFQASLRHCHLSYVLIHWTSFFAAVIASFCIYFHHVDVVEIQLRLG